MRVRRKGELLRVDLVPVEAEQLGLLLDDLDTFLETAGPTDPVRRRLFPRGYSDDEEASSEFAAMVEGDLLGARTVRLQACRAELPANGGRFFLDAEAADRWIRVLNDIRLAIGTRIGVTEDDDLDPTEQAAALYHWLTYAQEILVQHMMG